MSDNPASPASLTATALVEHYRRKTLSPVEATKAVLARIAALNPSLNAFLLVDEEAALGAARASEARWMKGAPQGLVDGVPATVKDIMIARGWPTLRGSKTVRRDQPWDEDAPMVARLREHGAVLIGKTTTPEFGWKAIGDSPLTGITRNPVEPGAHAGRQQRRRGGGGGDRHGPAASGHRRRRLDPHPQLLHRRVRHQADLWPGRGLAAEPVRGRLAHRAHDAHGGGRGADALRHRRLGRARPLRVAARPSATIAAASTAA